MEPKIVNVIQVEGYLAIYKNEETGKEESDKIDFVVVLDDGTVEFATSFDRYNIVPVIKIENFLEVRSLEQHEKVMAKRLIKKSRKGISKKGVS